MHGLHTVEDEPIIATALRESVEYVDATRRIEALLQRVVALDLLVKQLSEGLTRVTNPSLIRAHEKLVELEADMGAAGIGERDKPSGLILPERMKAN